MLCAMIYNRVQIYTVKKLIFFKFVENIASITNKSSNYILTSKVIKFTDSKFDILQFQSFVFVSWEHEKHDNATPRKYHAFLNINSVALFFSSKKAGLNAVLLERRWRCTITDLTYAFVLCIFGFIILQVLSYYKLIPYDTFSAFIQVMILF